MTGTVSLIIVTGVISCLILAVAAISVEAAEVPRVTKEEAKSMLGAPDVVVVDVRQPHDWDASRLKIRGAVREDPRNVNAWVGKYPKNKTLLFY